MRKYILTALLASAVAAPALAQDNQDNDRGRERAEQREERRAQRAQQPVRAERPQVADRANWSDRGAERQRAVQQQQANEPAFQQPALRRQGERRSWEQRRIDRAEAIQPRVHAPVTQDGGLERQRTVRVRDGSTDRQRYTRVRDGSTVRQSIGQIGSRDGQVNVRRGTGDRSSQYSGSTGQWNSRWRTDRRHDWRRYRDSNRSLYRLGRYRDPYGSRYRRFSIGFSLFPSYYQSSYWLDDPWMYRLPRAYGPYRWVRYYGDALLVNVYTGQVVDVVHDFFW